MAKKESIVVEPVEASKLDTKITGVVFGAVRLTQIDRAASVNRRFTEDSILKLDPAQIKSLQGSFRVTGAELIELVVQRAGLWKDGPEAGKERFLLHSGFQTYDAIVGVKGVEGVKDIAGIKGITEVMCKILPEGMDELAIEMYTRQVNTSAGRKNWGPLAEADQFLHMVELARLKGSTTPRDAVIKGLKNMTEEKAKALEVLATGSVALRKAILDRQCSMEAALTLVGAMTIKGRLLTESGIEKVMANIPAKASISTDLVTAAVNKFASDDAKATEEQAKADGASAKEALAARNRAEGAKKLITPPGKRECDAAIGDWLDHVRDGFLAKDWRASSMYLGTPDKKTGEQPVEVDVEAQGHAVVGILAAKMGLAPLPYLAEEVKDAKGNILKEATDPQYMVEGGLRETNVNLLKAAINHFGSDLPEAEKDRLRLLVEGRTADRKAGVKGITGIVDQVEDGSFEPMFQLLNGELEVAIKAQEAKAQAAAATIKAAKANHGG